MPKETFLNLPEEKRAKIIDVAIAEFESHSYQEASVNRIVRMAGISKGSFYQYFEDKRDLYRLLIDLMVKEKMGYITESMRNPKDLGFFDLLRDMYQSAFEFARDNPRYVNIGNLMLSDTSSPLYQELVKDNIGRARDVYSQLIRIGIERGELDPQINVDLIAHLFADLNVSATEYYLNNVSKDLDENLWQTLDELLLFLRKGISKTEKEEENDDQG